MAKARAHDRLTFSRKPSLLRPVLYLSLRSHATAAEAAAAAAAASINKNEPTSITSARCDDQRKRLCLLLLSKVSLTFHATRPPNTSQRFALGARDVCLVGKNDVLCPGISQMRGSTTPRLRLCMKLVPFPPPPPARVTHYPPCPKPFHAPQAHASSFPSVTQHHPSYRCAPSSARHGT